MNTDHQRLIDEFLADYATMKKLSKGSKEKYQYAAQAILTYLESEGRSLLSLTDEDALRLIQYVQQSHWSEATRQDYWKRWKKIYAWLHKHKGLGHPNVAARMQEYVYHRDRNLEEKKEILTEDEVLSVVSAEPNTCYKVSWAVLYEGGLRIGEALALRIRDVSKNASGFVLTLPKSKTEKRRIHLYGWSKDYVSRWLKEHPLKHDKDAPFLLNSHGGHLEYRSAAYRLQDSVRRAGIDKHITPHCLRHSRASHLANHLNEQQMCKFFGWSIGSDMPRTYIRENAIDLDHALKAVYGIADPLEKREAGVRCQWCGHRNALTADYCDSCHQSMDVGVQAHGVDQASQLHGLIMRMIEDKYGAEIDRVLRESTGGRL